MKIVDLSTDVAGRFAAKLLAMAGAEVCRPAAGSESVSIDDPLTLYLDAGKTVSELRDPATLGNALAGADVIFTTFDRGEYRGLAADRSAIPLSCVEVTTSSFGTTGPYASFRGGPLADWSAGGYLAITGEPDREPLIGPETLCAYVCGYTAALGAEVALRARGRDGNGRHVDISTMETMLGLHQSTFSRLSAGEMRTRTGRYAEVYPLTVLPCRSGYVSLGVVTDAEFDRLVIACGMPELAGDDRFDTRAARWLNRDALDVELARFLEQHEPNEVVEVLQACGVAAAVVADALEVIGNPQMTFRGFWAPLGAAVMPGNPVPAARVFAQSGDQARKRKPLPPNPLRTTAGLPLDGLTILDFTAYWAGPSATRTLADLGADVIWVERPRSRLDFDEELSDPRVLGQHLYHQKMMRHKRSVVLDLESAEGRSAARLLASKADVVVENFRPGVADKLGIGPAELCSAFPELVYVSLSGFGSGGPWGDWKSFGPNIEAASSILARTGYAGEGPMKLGHALPDGVGGVAGALAALRGLRERDERGHGGWFDISQLEVYAALSGEGILAASMTGAPEPRIGNRSHTGALQGVFPCRGVDQWVTIRLNDRNDAELFMAETGLGGLELGLPSSSSANETAISAFTGGEDKHALARRLQQAGLEAFPVLDPTDLATDPHLTERGFFVHFHCGDRNCVLPGTPFRCTPPLADTNGIAPRFGEHTAQILGALAAESLAGQQAH